MHIEAFKKEIKRAIRHIRSKSTSYQKNHMQYPPYIDVSNMKKIRYGKNKTSQISEILNSVDIEIGADSRFAHWIDEHVWAYNFDMIIGNMPPDYSLIINHSINGLIDEYSKAKGKIAKQNVEVLNGVKKYMIRVIQEIEKSTNPNLEKMIGHFSSMLDSEAKSLEDALQRILFWSSIMWQTGHRLVGLGRLDVILDSFSSSIDNIVIEDFLKELHRYYRFKSTALVGDIGQIIILGGKTDNNKYFCNKLTYAFITAAQKLKFPDPKILLRVADGMPEDLIDLSISCISTGTGSPLFSNDEVIVPALEKFGYARRDALNYVTSACWEPVSYGNSLEQNNLGNINFAIAFSKTLIDVEVCNCKNYAAFEELYIKHLRENVRAVLEHIFSIRWEQDPLFTLFTRGCIEKDLDINNGGAIYSNYGILSVGISNAVDSLINIKKMVFDDKEYDLSTLHKMWKNNSEEVTTINEKLKIERHHFGRDDDEAISLTNRLMDVVDEEVNPARNRFGGKIKFGLSSPAYVVEGDSAGATFDGRGAGEPTGVHISSKDGIPYTQLISFASQIKYEGHRTNGNVVDFIMNGSYVSQNPNAFRSLIKGSIKTGFFQMQMNVVDSETLIDAQENPEKYTNLIVRVWGFSAYFNDLPKDYQDVLIARAIESERVS